MLCNLIFSGINTQKYEKYVLAFCNSCVAEQILQIVSPTLNCELSDVGSLPIHVNEDSISIVSALTKENESLSKFDWDSYETSWDFKRHPLV